MPTPGPNVYPFDPTGNDPSCLISNELHTLTVVNNSNYHFIVPLFAPYFLESLTVYHQPVGSVGFQPLTLNIDYVPAYPYWGAQLRTGKKVYGAISFLNLQLDGQIRLSYQTVGGEYTLDEDKLIEITANIVYNPRITTWEQISGVNNHFPPTVHAWEPQDLVGQQDILDKLEGIINALMSINNNSNLLSHSTNYGNPHRTDKFQVGLGNLQNFPMGTIAEIVAGISTERYVHPAGLKAAMSLLDARQYLTLDEALTLTPVPKIMTYDVFLQMMRTFGILDRDDQIAQAPNRPTIIYPIDTGILTGNTPLRCLAYTGVITGSVTKSQTLTGNSSLVIPIGVNSIKFTGRGAVGTTVSAGGNMAAGSPMVNPPNFEVATTISEIPSNITGDQGSVSVRVVSPGYAIDRHVDLHLTTSTSTTRVYSASLPISQDSSSGQVEYGAISIVYTGTAPSVVNTPGPNATITLLGNSHVFEGSPNSSTLPSSRTVEVILDINASTTVSYNCPVGTDITATWFEPPISGSVAQTDTVWQIATTATFNTGTILEGTEFGKGPDFTLSAWTPTRNALASNMTYYVRSRWKMSDDTLSPWSDVVQFGFQATNIYPPEGQIIGRFCRNEDEWGYKADGMGGRREALLQPNAPQCGYIAGGSQAPVVISMNSYTHVNLRKTDFVLVQDGGTHPYQVAVPVKVEINNFLENIEDNRIRLYLKDTFYNQYLIYKAANLGSETNFRLPMNVTKTGFSNDIKIELVTNMSPSTVGRTNLEPNTFYIKIMLNSIGHVTLYNEITNTTKINFKLDTVTMFKDETGVNFINQGLVTTGTPTLSAIIDDDTLVNYSPV